MAQLIFKCPYLKGGGNNKAHLTHITKYISTREGVEFLAGEKEILSVCESMELEVEAKKENYVDYIATRPMVEKISAHGLFTSGNGEVALSKVAKEIAQHKGNVWLPIIALKREDAEKTGYDNVESWKILLDQYALEMAKNFKISDKNFRWYGAFHNHDHHPHIHMICYSTNPKEGFLSKTGIKNIKSGLMQNVYGDELKIIYVEKSLRRDGLKAESKKAVEELISNISNGCNENIEIGNMMLELSKILKNTKGKKVYGYLPPATKKMVDTIVDEFCKQPSISKAYDLWYEMQKEVVHNYTDSQLKKIPLSKQKEFKSIKNHIIYEADKLAREEMFEHIPMEENFADEYTPPVENDEITSDKNITPYVKWTDEYKKARKFLFADEDTKTDFIKALKLLQAESQNGNMLAVFDLGRMYAEGLGVEADNIKAQDYYKKALNGFIACENKKPWKYLEYRIGKMYAQGLGTEQNYEEAFGLYLKSAKQNFSYADFEVGKMYREGIGTTKNENKSEYHFGKAFLAFVSMENQSHDDKLQYRIGHMLQNGIGTEKDIIKAKEYFEKSATEGNPFAQYALGKIYLMGNGVERDKETAVKWFTLSANQGNEYAQYFLDNMDKWKEPLIFLAVSNVMRHIGGIFQNNQVLLNTNVAMKIDSKRMKKLKEKKVAQGHKYDDVGQKINY